MAAAAANVNDNVVGDADDPVSTYTKKMITIIVVYFDQRLGTAHSKRWSK